MKLFFEIYCAHLLMKKIKVFFQELSFLSLKIFQDLIFSYKIFLIHIGFDLTQSVLWKWLPLNFYGKQNRRHKILNHFEDTILQLWKFLGVV